MHLASAVIVLGLNALKDIQSELPKVALFAVPNPISDRKFNSIQTTKADKRIKLIFLGHVLEGKGVVELVSACRGMDRKLFSLDIIGDITDAMRRRLIEVSGADHAVWLSILGAQGYEYCMQKIDQSDVLVLPSTGLFEAFPYAILEAMRAARPVVATSRGAIPEMLAHDSEEPCGIVVKPGDVTALSGALERLIKRSDERAVLAQNGRKRLESLYLADRVLVQLKRIWFSK
jgi:glycosyltransferase involved in cell wall biosynthesis